MLGNSSVTLYQLRGPVWQLLDSLGTFWEPQALLLGLITACLRNFISRLSCRVTGIAQGVCDIGIEVNFSSNCILDGYSNYT